MANVASAITPDYPADMPTKDDLEKANRIIEMRRAALRAQTNNTVLCCSHCQAQQLVKDSTHITFMEYEHGYGHSSGAEWHDIEGKDHYICNTCNQQILLPAELNSVSESRSGIVVGKSSFFKARKTSCDGTLSD